MASVNLTGTLTNPEGEPDEGAIVKFTLLTTTGTTVSSSKSQLEVPQDGLYDIDIVYGNLRVDYINEDGSTRFVSIVTVNGDTTATSLPELLNASVPPTDSQLLEFQAILAACIAAQAASETAETGAVAAKDIAVAVSIIQYQTFAELEAISETVDYKQFTVAERANAAYTLQPLGYSALAGDATLSNGRVAQLQLDGTAKLEWFGAKQDAESLLDSATDDLAACNSAALRMLQEGGGTVLMSGLAALSGTLVIPQRVVFKGSSRFFANQFTDLEARPAGCGFYGLVGMNTNIVDIKLDIYNDGGTLRETSNNKVLGDYRHFGGVSDLIIYGNRSNTANPPTVIDKNITGDGIVLSGVRYPVIENIVTMFCAEKGLRAISFDYGLGSNACNNLFTSSVVALSNATGGIDISGGDSIMRGLYAGYNGGTGIVSSAGRGVYEFASWNNKADGIFITGASDSEYKGNAYDNDASGWRISGTTDCKAQGRSSANGRDATVAATDRCGVISSASNIDLAIDIQDSGTYLGVTYQQYGFRILQSVNKVNICNSSSTGNNLSDWLVTDPLMLSLHGNLPRGGEHAGFTLTDKILCDGNGIAQIGGVSANSWAGASVVAGSVNVARNSFVALNEASPTNITDIVSGLEGLPIVTSRISGGSAITFVHNNAKLRLNGLASRVLNTGESITFMLISGTVWQEV